MNQGREDEDMPVISMIASMVLLHDHPDVDHEDGESEGMVNEKKIVQG